MPQLKKTVFLSLFLLLQSGIGVFGVAAILDARYSGTIQQGIAVNGIPVGGMSTVEAAQKLESSCPFPALAFFKLEGSGKRGFIGLSEIDGRYSYLPTAEEASRYVSDKGKLINQLMCILRLRAAPADLPLKIGFSEEKLAEKIRGIEQEWKEPPQNASVKVINDRVEIVPEKNGYRLDFEETLKQASRALSGGILYAEAVGHDLKPDIDTGDLQGIDTLLSEYTTTFDAGAGNRAHNITVATGAINGTLLKPGEMFSLNKELGPRLAETGYLKAPVFIEDRLMLDIGGGICQVATTLYNAVLLSNLAIVERFPHPRPVNYVSPGRDATIAGDYLDLKFVNNTDTPVYISSFTGDGTITVQIFGAGKKDGHTVRITTEKTVIEPNVVIITDNTLPEGETRIKDPGAAGYEVRSYREVISNGKTESKTLISTDYYKPSDKIILAGPKPKGEEK
ncbi:MAG TPA: VanW family protein [Bacillota bacterium]|nr:VanW family protein [Bacillota bacterium]